MLIIERNKSAEQRNCTNSDHFISKMQPMQNFEEKHTHYIFIIHTYSVSIYNSKVKKNSKLGKRTSDQGTLKLNSWFFGII